MRGFLTLCTIGWLALAALACTQALPPDEVLVATNAAADSVSTDIGRAAVAAKCGDGVVQGAEECDDGNLANADACANNCTFSEDCTGAVFGAGSHATVEPLVAVWPDEWTVEGWVSLTGSFGANGVAGGIVSTPDIAQLCPHSWSLGTTASGGFELRASAGLQGLSAPGVWKVGVPFHYAVVYSAATQKLTAFVHGTEVASVAAVNKGFCTKRLDLHTIIGFKDNWSAGTLRSLRYSETARYAVPFLPPKRLIADASTKYLFEFAQGVGNGVMSQEGAKKVDFVGSVTWTQSACGSVCQPAAPTCLGTLAGTCNGSGSGLLNAADCPGAGKVCVAGACVACAPQLAPAYYLPVVGQTFGVLAVDVTGDGKADLVAANDLAQMLSVFPGLGNGKFGVRADYITKCNPRYLTGADFNKDGLTDVAVSCAGTNTVDSYTVAVFLNQGAGELTAQTDYTTTAKNPYQVVAADFNADGAIDLAVAVEASSSVDVFFNNGGGTFAPAATYPAIKDTDGLAVGDLNGDGKPDLVATNTINRGYASVFINNGKGQFAKQVDYVLADQPFGLALGDVSGDGKLDLVAANRHSDSLSVLIGTGLGTFGAKTDYPVGDNPQANLLLVDMSGDGKLDIVVPHYLSETVSVLNNLGGGKFGPKQDNALVGQPYDLSAADFNGDGLLDIVVANSTGQTLSVLLATCK